MTTILFELLLFTVLMMPLPNKTREQDIHTSSSVSASNVCSYRRSCFNARKKKKNHFLPFWGTD